MYVCMYVYIYIYIHIFHYVLYENKKQRKKGTTNIYIYIYIYIERERESNVCIVRHLRILYANKLLGTVLVFDDQWRTPPNCIIFPL